MWHQAGMRGGWLRSVHCDDLESGSRHRLCAPSGGECMPATRVCRPWDGRDYSRGHRKYAVPPASRPGTDREGARHSVRLLYARLRDVHVCTASEQFDPALDAPA